MDEVLKCLRKGVLFPVVTGRSASARQDWPLADDGGGNIHRMGRESEGNISLVGIMVEIKYMHRHSLQQWRVCIVRRNCRNVILR